MFISKNACNLPVIIIKNAANVNLFSRDNSLNPRNNLAAFMSNKRHKLKNIGGFIENAAK